MSTATGIHRADGFGFAFGGGWNLLRFDFDTGMMTSPNDETSSEQGNERAARQVTGGLEADDTLRAPHGRPTPVTA